MSATQTLSETHVGKDRACRHCGTPVAGLPHAKEEDGYCCEACYLGAQYRRNCREKEGDTTSVLVDTLAAALDAREHETGLHSKRVACHTVVLAKHFTSDAQQLQQVYWGALLHDIGKIGIPDSILQKNGSLSDAEWRVMRTHPEIGHRILRAAPNMVEVAEIVLCHEERFDGTGYPRGLSGASIPLWARLFAVIDTLDAITSDRPYREAHSFDSARAEILRQSGTQFDPVATEVFVAEQETLRAMVEVKCAAIDIVSREAISSTAASGHVSQLAAFEG
ncbi:MAG: HD-GYP domain-containing protein [Georgfuchsia sp.]